MVYGVVVCFLFVFGVEGHVRCVDCVCATEPPCSSDNEVGGLGAAALACALEKNTTLHTLHLSREFVVVCFVWGGRLIVVYGVVVCCLFVVGVEGHVRCVDCVCATEPPCSPGNKLGDAGVASLAQALEKNSTLQCLHLRGEFIFVLCFGRAFDCGLWCCGLLFLCVWGGACALC